VSPSAASRCRDAAARKFRESESLAALPSLHVHKLLASQNIAQCRRPVARASSYPRPPPHTYGRPAGGRACVSIFSCPPRASANWARAQPYAPLQVRAMVRKGANGERSKGEIARYMITRAGPQKPTVSRALLLPRHHRRLPWAALPSARACWGRALAAMDRLVVAQPASSAAAMSVRRAQPSPGARTPARPPDRAC
jgi:hypothetical protein